MSQVEKNYSASQIMPKFIWVAIDQVRVKPTSFAWTDDGNFLPMSIPAVKRPALDLLQLVQPIIVTNETSQAGSESKKKSKHQYNLLAGRRSLQLLTEQNSCDTKIRVILFNEHSMDNKTLEVMDILSSTLLRRPDDATLALLAFGLIEDRSFRQVATTLLDSSKIEDVAILLGKSKSTIHRLLSEEFCTRLRNKSPSPESKASLGDALDIETK